MHITKAIIICAACALTLQSRAQGTLVNRLDSMLAARETRAKAKYDTAYISYPDKKWKVKLSVNASGTNLSTRGTTGGEQFKSEMEAEMKATVGVTVSYRGLSLGYSANPAKLAGKNKDNELSLSSYGNRMGADIVYTSAKTFSGTAEQGGDTYGISAGSVSMEMLQANAYYAFSHRRFSFPAVFTQSQIQKRSHGSWLLGLSAFAGRIKAKAGVVPGADDTRIETANVALGGGYAYNFVISGKWLLHISAMPHLVVASYNTLTVGDNRKRTPYRFPALVNVGRIAAVRNFKNSFIGMTAVVNLWRQGDSDELMLESLKWRARIFYGFRF